MTLRIPTRVPPRCEECGENPVPHRLTYSILVFEEILTPYLALVFTLGSLMRKPSVWAASFFLPYFMRLCVVLGVAEFLDAPDSKTTLLGQVLWEAATKRGIILKEFRMLGLVKNDFLARFSDGRLFAYQAIPIPLDADPVWWMDNKAILKKKLRKAGIPVARGRAVHTLRGARKVFASLVPPVIAKPHEGSGSRHTVMHIHDAESLARGFAVASQISPAVMIEEELHGMVHRVTVVNGKFTAALRRIPPSVVGDGSHTVEQLLKEENGNPKRRGPYFTAISLGDAAMKELAWQNLTKDSVPQAGRRVQLHPKMNWSVGGITEDVTDRVHPDNREMFERAAHVLRAPIVGIDLIMEDLSRSWKEQERCGILECNSGPFIEVHHLPYIGEPRDVAGKVWEMVS